MIQLPSSTVVNRRIPKDRFYLGNRDVAELKALFTNSVDKVVWTHKLSSPTMNLPPSEAVKEIEIFETTLLERSVDRRVFATMDEMVKPHAVLHVFRTTDHVEVVFGYRQPGEKTVRYYSKAWPTVEEIALDFSAPTMDALYLSLMRQLSAGAFAARDGDSVAEAKARDARRLALENTIKNLEQQLRREKQANRQFDLSGRIRAIRAELKTL